MERRIADWPRDQFQKRMIEMLEYEIDTASDQIVHWLKDEVANERPRVTYSATRNYVSDENVNLQTAGLGEEPEISSPITVGILEIGPVDTEDGWQLILRIDDDVGSHLPEDDSVSGLPEDIDLDDFRARFVSSDNGTEFVSVRVDSVEAKKRFDLLFADIVRDRHIASAQAEQS